MEKTSASIETIIQRFRGQAFEARYLGFFWCFNQEEFYQAHDVLEGLWLKKRGEKEANFFKALIQTAGAFVHLEKGRLRPAGSLLELARGYLEEYPEEFLGIAVTELLGMIDDWSRALTAGEFRTNPLKTKPPPKLAVPLEKKTG